MDSKHHEGKAAGNLLQKYKDILISNGIVHSVSGVFLSTPASLKGEGMTSQAYYVTIKFEDASVKPLHLFSKTRLPQDEMKGMFENEARFFKEYFPAAEAFCCAKGKPDLLDFYPKCYYADEEMIVFENLVTEKGYILLSKKDRQGLESARIALLTLAKHHAVSYAFIKECGGAEIFFKRFPNLDNDIFSSDFGRNFVDPLIKNGMTSNIKILEKSNVEGKDDAVSLLKAHQNKGFELIWEILQYRPENEKILTLNHGDYWNNNMMFLRDEKTQKLTGGHKALDFQVTRYNSPVLDIGNFMYTSMKPEARRQHLEELLRVYLDALNSTLKDLGTPMELTYEELFQLFRRKFQYGFWFSIWLAAEAGYAVINNVKAQDPEGFSKEFNEKVEQYIDENPEKCEQAAKDLVKLMNEYLSLKL